MTHPRNTQPTLTLSNVSKRFGDIDAVHDVTLSVQPGEIVGFVGPNGAGKTTTISMIMGYLHPTRGTVRVLGQTILPERAHKIHKRIGFVAGDMVLPSSLTGKQFLSFNASRNGRNQERYTELIEQLAPVLDRPIKMLSRGNKQKVALIAALQHDPSILVLDEPTSGLDPLMQETFLRTVREEAKKGVTVFMSSHILSEVSSICDRIVFMKAGRFILDQPIETILEKLGKVVTVTSSDAAKLKKFLPQGTEIIKSSPGRLELRIQSDNLKPFLRWLTTKEFSDITIEERDLDDIFHELYVDMKESRENA